MSYTVYTRGQALTQAQVLSYYNTIGNISYDDLKQQTMRIYGMDSTTFDCWMGWIVNEGYARTNGAYEGYLTQCTATNIYVAYSNHTAQGFCQSLGGSDSSYTVSAMQSAGLLARADQQAYQADLRCAFLAMANPDQRCYACNGVDSYPTVIASWFDGSYMIYVFEDPNGVRSYSYTQNGGVFGGTAVITFTERTSSPAGTYNPCYMTNGNDNALGYVANNSWNTCITGKWQQVGLPNYGLPSSGANALPNCTGYAQGRSLEIYNECMGYNPNTTLTHPFIMLNQNAGEWYRDAELAGFAVNPTTPATGAIMVWGQTGDAGHVAVIERVEDNDTVITTESAYGGWAFGADWCSMTRVRGDGNWLNGSMWGMPSSYYFIGFILNPANPDTPIPPTPTPTGSKSKMWMYMKRRDLRPQYRRF